MAISKRSVLGTLALGAVATCAILLALSAPPADRLSSSGTPVPEDPKATCGQCMAHRCTQTPGGGGINGDHQPPCYANFDYGYPTLSTSDPYCMCSCCR
jgi:hypothetical protein